MIELTRRDARRIAIAAQRLTAARPGSVLDAVRGVGGLRVDATSYVAPSADLVLWSRLGRGYRPADLRDAVDDRTLIEFQGWLRPASDMALFTAAMAEFPGADARPWKRLNAAWLAKNRDCADQIVEELRERGPLPARDLPDCCAVPWRSSGWNNSKDTTMLLEQLSASGKVAVSRREGRERLWDIASRVYPGDAPVPSADAMRLRDEQRLRVLGIARAQGPDSQDEPWGVRVAGEEARIDGVRGTWRVDPEALDRPFRGRTALLSPFDRLIYDRKRLDELFWFDYALEMYKSPELRAFGYYALPILHGDRLVGTVDVEARPREDVLILHAVRYPEPVSRAIENAVATELRSLAAMIDLDLRMAG